MAKDDYDYIVFKILTYLYGCLKRKNIFDKKVFRDSIVTQEVQEEYLTDILRMMTRENLIEGLYFIKAWGNTYILVSDLADMHITSEGIHYVLDNDKMRKIKDKVLENTAGAIFELVKLVLTGI